MEQKASKFGVLANSNYRKLWLAAFTSHTGSIIGGTAFTFFLLEKFSDQPVYTTLVSLMTSLPTLLVFFLVGVLADRFDRQKIASNTDLLCAGLTILFLLAVQTEFLPLIFGVLFLRAGVNKFFYPAQAAMVQGALPKEQQVTAAGFNQMTMSLLILFGNSLGALCYWSFGIEGAILVDFLSFLVSAWLIRSVRLSEEVRLPNGKSSWRELSVKSVFADLKVGSQYILRFRLLLTLILGLLIVGLCQGGMFVLPTFMMKYKLAPENYEEMIALMGIFSGIGILLGSPFATWLAKKMKLYALIILGFFLGGVAYAGASQSENAWFFLATNFAFGFTMPMVNVAFFGWMAQIVDPKMMGRVQGWMTPLSVIASGISLGFIAWAFPVYISVSGGYMMMAGLLFATTVFYLLTLPKLVREYEGRQAEEEAAIGVGQAKASAT